MLGSEAVLSRREHTPIVDLERRDLPCNVALLLDGGSDRTES